MKRHLCRHLLTAAIVGSAALTIPCQAAEPTSKAAVDAQPDAEMQAVLDQLSNLGPKPIESLTPPEARRQPSPTDAVIQLLQTKGTVSPDKLPPVAKVEMQAVAGPQGGKTPVRVYTPSGNGPFAAIVYFHGGGWVIANLDTYDPSCRALCAMANAVVVSVDYRRAPEHKFPAAHEDCYAAMQYVMAKPAQFNIDASKVAVVGESAGGNLATAACIMATQRKGKLPVHQGLIYPITNFAFDTPSYRANAKAKPLNKAMMQWFFKHYLNDESDGEHMLVSPLRTPSDMLASLPPATLVTAEIDPLRSEGMAYAQALKAAGVDVAQRDYVGVTHEFFGMAAVVDKAKDAEAFVVGRLKQAFAAAASAARSN